MVNNGCFEEASESNFMCSHHSNRKVTKKTPLASRFRAPTQRGVGAVGKRVIYKARNGTIMILNPHIQF